MRRSDAGDEGRCEAFGGSHLGTDCLNTQTERIHVFLHVFIHAFIHMFTWCILSIRAIRPRINRRRWRDTANPSSRLTKHTFQRMDRFSPGCFVSFIFSPYQPRADERFNPLEQSSAFPQRGMQESLLVDDS